jgi:hypothetical protein
MLRPSRVGNIPVIVGWKPSVMGTLFDGYTATRAAARKRATQPWDEMFPADAAAVREPYRELYPALAAMTQD